MAHKQMISGAIMAFLTVKTLAIAAAILIVLFAVTKDPAEGKRVIDDVEEDIKKGVVDPAAIAQDVVGKVLEDELGK